jgi:hypothetical protein
VSVQLASEKKQFRVGTEWTEATMGFTPPLAVMGDISASITIPPETEVLVDAITFHPILHDVAP